MCFQIGICVVGRGASWKGAANISLPCVSLHVVQQAKLNVELFPTRGTLKVLIVATTLLLAVLPSLKALEIFPTIRAERARGHSYHISNMYSKFEKSLHFSKWWGTIRGLWYHAMRFYYIS